jgi:hypothetical protein
MCVVILGASHVGTLTLDWWPSHGQQHRRCTPGRGENGDGREEKRRERGMSGNFTSGQHRVILSHYALYQTQAYQPRLSLAILPNTSRLHWFSLSKAGLA